MKEHPWMLMKTNYLLQFARHKRRQLCSVACYFTQKYANFAEIAGSFAIFSTTEALRH